MNLELKNQKRKDQTADMCNLNSLSDRVKTKQKECKLFFISADLKLLGETVTKVPAKILRGNSVDIAKERGKSLRNQSII